MQRIREHRTNLLLGLLAVIIWSACLAVCASPPRVEGAVVVENPRPRLVAQWQWDIIRKTAPSRAVELTMIAYCESRLDANAVGSSGELGWFQIHPVHQVYPGFLRNPEINTAIAAYFADERPSLSDWARTRYGCEEWWNG